MSRIRRRAALALLLLPLVSYVAWDQFESRRLRRATAAIAARGEPVTAADPYAVVLTTEQRDAARIYLAATERVPDAIRDAGFRYRTLDVDNPDGAPGTVSELEARYRKDTPALQLLDQATPLDFHEFGDVAPEFYSNQDPLVGLGGLNALRADLASLRGNGDEAVTSLVASVRLLRTLRIAFYRYQASSRLLGSVRILLRRATPGDASLAGLQRAFQELPDTDGLTAELLEVRAQFIDDVERRNRTPAAAIAARLLRPLVRRAARQQLATFDEAIAVTRLPWPQRIDGGAALERRYAAAGSSERRGLFVNLVEPPGYGVARLALTAAAIELASRRIAITALAVERHRRAHGGALPATLDAVVPAFLPAVPRDPFSRSRLVYIAEPDGYAIYSVDTNRKDDGGVLHGIGSRAQLMPGRDAPRDLGIRVPVGNRRTLVKKP